MNRILTSFWTVLICTQLTSLLSGQDAPPLPSEQVEVIKNFEARILKAQILPVTLSKVEIDTTKKPEYNYRLSPSQLQIDYRPPVLRPLALKRAPAKSYFPFMLSVGYGTQRSPLAKLSYNYYNGENITLHMDGNYQAAHSNTLEHQGFREARLRGTLQVITEAGMQLQSQMHYQSTNNLLYGYDHAALQYSAEQVARPINLYGFGLGISNAFPTRADVDYRLSASFSRLLDSVLWTENILDLQTDIKKWLHPNHALGLELELRHIAPGSDSASIATRNNYQIRPFYAFVHKNFNVRAGANITENSGIKLYPNAEIQINVLPGKLIVFANWAGGLKTNSQTELLDINPYLTPRRDSLITSNFQEVFVGIKGQYAPFGYELKLGRESVLQMPLYIQDADSRYFRVIYDDMDIWHLAANLSALITKKFDLRSGILLNRYNPAVQKKAWHLPNVEFHFSGVYKAIKDRLRLELKMTGQNGVAVSNEREQLGGLFDLSIQSDFMFTKNIGIYALANNLLNNRRERWINYPIFGRNFHIGIHARF